MKTSDAGRSVRLKTLMTAATLLALLALLVNGFFWQVRSRASAEVAGGTPAAGPDIYRPGDLELHRMEASLRVQPENAALRMRFAQLLFLAGQQTRALTELRIIESRQPKNPELHLRKSMVLKHLDRLDEAERAARLAIRYRPAYIQAMNWLGEIYLETGRSQEALQLFTRALKSDPSSHDALLGQGRAREQLYIAKHPVSPQQITDPVAKAVKLEPDNPRGVLTLARMTFNYLMKPDRAEELALKATTLDPADPEPWLILTEIALFRPATEQELIRAGGYALQAAERAPRDWRPPYLFGRVLLKQNEPAEAVRFFKKSLEIEKTPDAVYQLSQAARRAGQLDLARQYGALYSRWNVFMERRKTLLGDIQRKPGEADYYYKLAELYAEADAPDPAENWLKKAVKVRNDADRAARITAKVEQLRASGGRDDMLVLP